MIEFNGELTGKAKKYSIITEKKFLLLLFAVAIPIGFPLFYGVFSRAYDFWAILFFYLIIYISSLLLVLFVPIDKKEITNRVYIEDDEYIVVQLVNGKEEYRHIEDVKKVYDFGEFYAMKFYYGKVGYKFICQKNLLSKGTLKDFELLFEGKIR